MYCMFTNQNIKVDCTKTCVCKWNCIIFYLFSRTTLRCYVVWQFMFSQRHLTNKKEHTIEIAQRRLKKMALRELRLANSFCVPHYDYAFTKIFSKASRISISTDKMCIPRCSIL